MAIVTVEDNRALAQASAQALRRNIPLIVLFIISPQDYVAHDRSPRRIDFTLRNLALIKTSLTSLNIPLHTVTHTPRRTIPSFVLSLLRTFKATHLYANIEYEVDELRRDIKICELAKAQGIKPVFCHDKCIVAPGIIETKEGKTYTVSRYHIVSLQLSLLYLGILSLPKELDYYSEC
jgi:deoxyribodipyrimidine photo-lyase